MNNQYWICLGYVLALGVLGQPAVHAEERGPSPAITPKVSPLKDLFVPIGQTKALARAVPLAGYPIIKETAKGYLVLIRIGTNLTIGLIPKIDEQRNPTANVDGNRIVIRPRVNTYIYQGYIPFDANKRYEVVGETETNYQVQFSIGDYSTVCGLSKTTVVYSSETDIQKELAVSSSILPTQTEANDITTISGKRYTDFTVRDVNPCGITIKHAAGITKLYFPDLPEALRKKYGYEPRSYQQCVLKEKRIQALISRKGTKNGYKLIQVLEDGSLAQISSWFKAEPVFIWGLSKGYVDGDYWRGELYPIGYYEYTTVNDVPKRIAKCAPSLEIAYRVLYGNDEIKSLGKSIGTGSQLNQSSASAKGQTPLPQYSFRYEDIPWGASVEDIRTRYPTITFDKPDDSGTVNGVVRCDNSIFKDINFQLSSNGLDQLTVNYNPQFLGFSDVCNSMKSQHGAPLVTTPMQRMDSDEVAMGKMMAQALGIPEDTLQTTWSWYVQSGVLGLVYRMNELIGYQSLEIHYFYSPTSQDSSGDAPESGSENGADAWGDLGTE